MLHQVRLQIAESAIFDNNQKLTLTFENREGIRLKIVKQRESLHRGSHTFSDFFRAGSE